MGVTSVASLVREVISRDPFIVECLHRGIVNQSELARRVVEEIAKRYGFKPSLPAVKMAIARLASRISREPAREVARVVAHSALAVQDSVALVTTPREELPSLLKATAELGEKTRFIQVTQSIKAATVVVAEEDLEYILKSVKKPLDVIRGQSVIIMVSPREIIETPGVVAFITSYLASHGINVTQIISSYLDTLVVLDSKDAARAYTLLHDLIRSLREYLGE